MLNILSDREAAIRFAKKSCIDDFISQYDLPGLEDHTIDCIMEDEDLWLTRSSTCACTCGETSCIEMVFFERELTEDHFIAENSGGFNKFRDYRYNKRVGYCQSCGVGE